MKYKINSHNIYWDNYLNLLWKLWFRHAMNLNTVWRPSFRIVPTIFSGSKSASGSRNIGNRNRRRSDTKEFAYWESRRTFVLYRSYSRVFNRRYSFGFISHARKNLVGKWDEWKSRRSVHKTQTRHLFNGP